MEGIKQNIYENDEVNEIKYKYQEEKRTNTELKERIMRLQNNMITSSIGHKDQSLNKVKYIYNFIFLYTTCLFTNYNLNLERTKPSTNMGWKT